MAEDLVLSLPQARRLAVRSQYLAGPEPATGVDGMRQVLRGLRVLQIDPVNVRAGVLRYGGGRRGHQVAAAIESLASFAGAASVSYSGPVAFGVS